MKVYPKLMIDEMLHIQSVIIISGLIFLGLLAIAGITALIVFL